jgi:hypothetical protein
MYCTERYAPTWRFYDGSKGVAHVKSKLGQSVALLSAEQRLNYYRTTATEVMRLAKSIKNSTLRAQYLQLAAGWRELAFELENSLHMPSESADTDHKPAH